MQWKCSKHNKVYKPSDPVPFIMADTVAIVFWFLFNDTCVPWRNDIIYKVDE